MNSDLTSSKKIIAILKEKFSPEYLEVINESDQHNVPPNSETHFKVVIVSDVFESVGRVRRHQSVYEVLKDFLSGPVHALALHTYTEAEWSSLEQNSLRSPECHGGSK